MFSIVPQIVIFCHFSGVFLNHRLVAIFPRAKSAGANLPINAEYLR
ncbi:hypothetical protein HMPREF1574_00830 [Gardnerella pickettii JCP7659]|uniref:Uncharacterized protein n=1 Tax=Gardnerella pickettii JCP8017A TaxID=1261062 RepID=T2PK38_9BIFI|nr:hypothetical protein HMPREF1577_00969 [Gardnerella pickettii JCP8017A]EPI55006.1 hypothetical protein HMPREF1574_00830 [Gardnerella pickettii JCP7659]